MPRFRSRQGREHVTSLACLTRYHAQEAMHCRAKQQQDTASERRVKRNRNPIRLHEGKTICELAAPGRRSVHTACKLELLDVKRRRSCTTGAILCAQANITAFDARTKGTRTTNLTHSHLQ